MGEYVLDWHLREVTYDSTLAAGSRILRLPEGQVRETVTIDTAGVRAAYDRSVPTGAGRVLVARGLRPAADPAADPHRGRNGPPSGRPGPRVRARRVGPDLRHDGAVPGALRAARRATRIVLATSLTSGHVYRLHVHELPDAEPRQLAARTRSP